MNTTTDTTTEAPAATEALPGEVYTGDDVPAEHTFGGQYRTRMPLHKPLARASADMEPIQRLYLREPTAGDLRGIKLADLAQFEAGALLTLLPRIAMPRLAPAEVQALHLRDMIALGNAVAGFLD